MITRLARWWLRDEINDLESSRSLAWKYVDNGVHDARRLDNWRTYAAPIVKAYGRTIAQRINYANSETDTEIVKTNNPLYQRYFGPHKDGYCEARAWVVERKGDKEALRMAVAGDWDPEPNDGLIYRGFPVIWRGEWDEQNQ